MLKAKAETDDFFFKGRTVDLVLLSCPFMSNEDRLQREKIPAEFLPFPLTARLGLYVALKLHALMDRGGGGGNKRE